MIKMKIVSEFLIRAAALFVPLPVVIVLSIAVCQSGCGKDKSEKSPERASASDDTSFLDDTFSSVDHDLCREAFDFITSQCGAQFFSRSGNLMTQNDLLEACGQPKADCAVECYSTDKDCSSLKSCLKGTCGL